MPENSSDVYKVDSETANIEDGELTPASWPQVDEADRREFQQFIDEKAFKKIYKSQITAEMIEIDAKWVRKWKRQPDMKLKMKSRLGARCFDAQKDQLQTRSTTATRLSQRILVSQAASSRERNLESLDVAGGFLKGFDLQQIQKALQS